MTALALCVGDRVSDPEASSRMAVEETLPRTKGRRARVSKNMMSVSISRDEAVARVPPWPGSLAGVSAAYSNTMSNYSSATAL
ncbi:hypothetical protein E2C01_016608 [Portunus trituberculatus]|uniref:Uncharacterized protein n=1 Tax=Portunus trituberculatus TaxID=210409 RepID=A0A5B7DRD2_PORTR|nr:hypothetical protein [Portunus trituberculatus]